MTNVYEEEKKSIGLEKSVANNFMTSLIRASVEDNTSTPSQDAQGGLTESEIYGNIFVFNFAGHDTIAHTLAFTVVVLSAHPTVQDWLAEELRHVLGDEKPEDWEYQSVYPRLRRCLGVLVCTTLSCSPEKIH